MSQYGARRLIAINSGNYSFANIELTKPVHLAASNNRGKSTLVNSLQFLYIDDFTKMRFGHRNHDDSRRHYFGADRAYLIFECLTPTGIQCMLVRGLSNLRGGQFERYVYDGEFLDADYLDDGNVRFFESVRTRLADRHLTLVRNSDLWQVLAGNLPSDGEKSLPRLNILPLRKRKDYLAFRDVFVRLLSLSNVDARALRQLVIGSHGRQIGERKIDVAAEYKAEFDLAERSEHHLNFIRAAASEIDKGREVRLEIAALTSKFMAVAPRDGLTRLGVTSSLRRKRLRCRRKWPDWNKVAGMRPGRKSHCWSSKVDLRRYLKAAENEFAQLRTSHKKWSAYSIEFIKEMRDKAQHQAIEVAERTQHLDTAGKLDLQTMRNRVQQLRTQLETNRKAVAQWEETAAAELRRAGYSNEEIASSFRVLNPSLLKLIVGDTLTINDLDTILSRIRAIASRIERDIYSDEALTARLSGVPGPDDMMLLDPEHLAKTIAVNEQDLLRHIGRLNAAENQVAERNALNSLRNDHNALCNELAEYDRYTKASRRPCRNRETSGASKLALDEQARGNPEVVGTDSDSGQ